MGSSPKRHKSSHQSRYSPNPGIFGGTGGLAKVDEKPIRESLFSVFWNALKFGALLGVASWFLDANRTQRKVERAMASVNRDLAKDAELLDISPDYRAQIDAFMADRAKWRIRLILRARARAVEMLGYDPAGN